MNNDATKEVGNMYGSNRYSYNGPGWGDNGFGVFFCGMRDGTYAGIERECKNRAGLGHPGPECFDCKDGV